MIVTSVRYFHLVYHVLLVICSLHDLSAMRYYRYCFAYLPWQRITATSYPPLPTSPHLNKPYSSTPYATITLLHTMNCTVNHLSTTSLAPSSTASRHFFLSLTSPSHKFAELKLLVTRFFLFFQKKSTFYLY